jgi:glycosyltransferase involved in cell wall biosynthesis
VSTSLTVVIPVYNDAPHLEGTLDALTVALDGSGFDADVVVVDDGSSDGSAAVAEDAASDDLSLRVLRQPNEGRFGARKAGLTSAHGELVLLLDGRVRLMPDALRFVHSRLTAGELVWNGHVHIETASPLGNFWRLLAELAWADYFDAPRTTSFALDDFDRFPKGTGCFLAPRALLVEAFDRFRTVYRDVRLANDDTPILRDIAARVRIGISPNFACVYEPRTSLRGFLRHSVHRGVVFLDGHGTPTSRFFPAVVTFFPVSAVLAALAIRRPIAVLGGAALASGVAAATYAAARGRPRNDIETLLVVTPLYVLGHSLGMWKGLGKLAQARLGL